MNVAVSPTLRDEASAAGPRPPSLWHWPARRPARRSPAALDAATPDLLKRLAFAVYDRIEVQGERFVGVRLTDTALAHGLALALPEEVRVKERPRQVPGTLVHTGTVRIPIEGRDEWLSAAARRSA